MVSARPNDPRAECGIGDSYSRLFRTTEALYHYNRAIALADSMAAAWRGRGHVLLELGKIDEAQRSFERAITADPKAPENYMGLADLGCLRADSPMMRHLEELAALSPTDSEQVPGVAHLAMAKAFEDAGRYNDALTHYIAGNAILRGTVTYDEDVALRQIRRMQELFPSEVFTRECGCESEIPVFIVGMPRSGSTLVEQVLASHHDVFGAGETDLLPNLLQSHGLRTEAIPTLSNDVLTTLGSAYVSALQGYSRRSKRIVNKSLGNYLMIGTIRLILPKAKVIHIRRNALDTCVSCFSKFMPCPFSYDLGEMGRHYRAYDTLMGHWREVLPPSSFLDVSYESMVADFETQARRIVAFCGLGWDERCLRFHETRRAVRTVSASQVRKPLYKGSSGRWNDCGDALKPLLRELGPCIEVTEETALGAHSVHTHSEPSQTVLAQAACVNWKPAAG